jgi:hypothetical protein
VRHHNIARHRPSIRSGELARECGCEARRERLFGVDNIACRHNYGGGYSGMRRNPELTRASELRECDDGIN